MSSGFLLDTNVLLELMRERPAAAVLDWFAKNSQTAMHISSVTPAEILIGIALLPGGKRRSALAEAAEQMFEQDTNRACRPSRRCRLTLRQADQRAAPHASATLR